MSALGHMLEERGLATSVIALVLPHVEKTRPPRALMTPFLLGRPLGEPNDAAFQRRVLLQALRLLTRTDGPVILDHFADDNPSGFDRSDWRPAVALAVPGAPEVSASMADWEAAFRAELALVLPVWERFKARFGRSSVGLSGQAVQAWPAFATSFLDGAVPNVPLTNVPLSPDALHETPALAIRFLVDDIKALYGEAVQADGGPPSARQIDGWFWGATVAGRLLQALRLAALKSPNSALKTVGGRFFVPIPYVPA